MKKITLFFSMAAIVLAAASCSSTKKMDTYPMVGGAMMYPTKTIVENAVNSKDHTTLVAAVKAAGLAQTLSGTGPFTVFAPTNEAFNKLPDGTLTFLLKPENKPELTKILTYHVIPGRVSSRDLKKMIRRGGGTASLTTVQGSMLKATMENGMIYLTDVLNNKTPVTQADVMQKNGVIHVIGTVLMPNKPMM